MNRLLTDRSNSSDSLKHPASLEYKTHHLSQHSQISLSRETNMEALTKTLGEIQIIERRKLLVGNKLLLTLMSSPVLQKSISVTGLTNCYHISGVNPHQVWVSDGFNIILADTQKGDKLYNIEDPMQYPSGIHTVNTEYELIYINKKT